MNIKRYLNFAGLFLPVALAAAGATYWTTTNRAPADVAVHAGAVQYTCPMHPNVVSDKSGDCPICGMHLVPKVATPEKTADAPAASGSGCCGGMAAQPAALVCPFLAAQTNMTSCPMHRNP